MLRSTLRPTPAMVLACLALAIALSGVGYAATTLPRNSVGTAQLQKNAVTSAKVKNRSLLASDFKLGQLPAGAPGAKGEPGEKGDKGDQGPPGLTDVQLVIESSPNRTTAGLVEVTVSCPSGKRVIGGGTQIVSSPVFPITKNFPTADLTGWTGAGFADSSGPNWSVRVHAICARVS